MNKKKVTLIAVIAAVLIAALAVTGVVLLLQAGENAPESDDSLRVDLVTVIPAAYMGEEYDLKEIIEMREGVEYSAQVFYQNYDTMEEFEIPVTDLVFCQEEDFDVNILFTAKKGEEIAQRALDIPVNIRADEMDEMFSTSGLAGYADTGIVKNLSTDPQYLVNENSKTSLSVAFQGTPEHEYGLVIMSMAREPARPLYTDQSWENAAVTFWVYNPMEYGIEFQMRLIQTATGLDTDWNDQEDADSRIAQPGQWTQIVFSLRKYGITQMLTNQKDLVAVKMQYLGRPAPGEQYAYSMYMDEIDIVDASAFPELDTKPVVSDESIEQGWENIRLDTGWQSAQTLYDHDIFMGDGSSCSLFAQFPKESNKEGYFVALAPEWSVGKAGMKTLPDMTGGTLTGYFKFANADPAVEVYLTKRVNNQWQTSNTLKMTLESAGNGWYKGTLDVFDFEFTTDRNDGIIRICFAFPGASVGSQVWMDTVKFAPKDAVKVKESAEKDWINLPADSGMSNVIRYSYSADYKKAEGSVRSVLMVAPATEDGVLVFSPEYGLNAGVISKLPDMRQGTLHGWFYFGEQAPKASVLVYNTKWNGSNKSGQVDFIFEDKGDGWYYGSVPASLLENYYEGDGSQIIRIALTIPAGYSVYVDGLMLDAQEQYQTKFDANDLFASGIFTTEGIKQGNGYAIVTDVTNNSADAVTLWATEKSGWPKVGISFPTAVDFSAYTNLNLDAKWGLVGSKWVGIYLDYLDAEGNRQRAAVGTDISAEDWEEISIPLAKFVGADLKQVMGVMVCANFEDGFAADGKNQMWFDNLCLRVVTPPPTPENPLATAEDDDLISGSFTATADIAGIRGTLKVAVDDEGKSTSNAMLLMWANDPSGWPRATFLFDKEQDWSAMEALTLDTKIIGTHPWVSVEIINRGQDDTLIYSKGGAFDTTAGKWNTTKISMSSFTGVDLTKVCGIRINVNLQENMEAGALAQVYIDNVYVTEKVILPEDKNDLLADAKYVWGNFSGGNYLYDNLSQQVYGDDSIRSWMFAADAAASGWPKAQLLLAESQDMTGMKLVFDVKFENARQWLRVKLDDSNYTAVISKMDTELTGEGWHHVELDLSGAAIEAGKDLTDIRLITFNFDFEANAGQERAVYIDNVRLVTAEEVPEEPSEPSEPSEPEEPADADLLADAEYVWGNFSGSNYFYDNLSQQVCGEDSTNSWMFAANAAASGWPKAQLLLAESQDMTGMKLVFDVKFENARQWLRVKLDDSNYTAVINKMDSELTGEGWHHVELDLSAAAIEAGKDLTDIQLITFNFDFETNAGQERAVYIDNVRLVTKEETPEEPADTDLLATSQIEYTYVTEATKLKASLQDQVTNNSLQALKMEVTGDGYYQWPKATMTLAEPVADNADSFTVDVERTYSDWNFRVEFLDENNNVLGNHLIGTGEKGWQTHTFKLSELSADAVTEQEVTSIKKVRFTFYLPTGLSAGNAMYVDNAAFIYPEDTDLIDTAQITYINVSEDTKLAASLQSDKVNGSKQAMKMEVTGDGYFQWPKATLTLKHAIPEGADSFTVDVERTYSDWNFRVEFLDENDNMLGNHLIGTGEKGWQTHTFKLSEMSVDAVTEQEIASIKKVRFSFYLKTDLRIGDAIYVDNAAFIKQTQSDLIDSSSITYSRVTEEKKLEAALQSDVTNGSEKAIRVGILGAGYEQWPIITLDLADPVAADSAYFTVDVERTCSDWNFRVEFLDENNNVLGNHLIGTGDNGWLTHKFKLSEMSVNALDSSEVTKIAKVKFTMYLLSGLSAGDAMYIDNAAFLSE